MKKLTVFSMIVLLALLAHTPTAGQDMSPAALSVTPNKTQVAAGQTATLTVGITDVQELYAFDIRLHYDPAILSVVDAEPTSSGTQVAQGQFLDAGFAIVNEVDDDAGNIHYAMTQLNPSEAQSGSGILVVVQLRGVAEGAETTLAITSAQLSRRDGTLIEATTADGTITVTSESGEDPTGTPVPTQEPRLILPTSTPQPSEESDLAAQPAAGPPTATPYVAPTQTPVPEKPVTTAVTETPTNEPPITPQQPTATSAAVETRKATVAAPEPTATPTEQNPGEPVNAATVTPFATEQTAPASATPVTVEGEPHPASLQPFIAPLVLGVALATTGLVFWRRRG